jgi:hypothetical protein
MNFSERVQSLVQRWVASDKNAQADELQAEEVRIVLSHMTNDFVDRRCALFSLNTILRHPYTRVPIHTIWAYVKAGISLYSMSSTNGPWYNPDCVPVLELIRVSVKFEQDQTPRPTTTRLQVLEQCTPPDFVIPADVGRQILYCAIRQTNVFDYIPFFMTHGLDLTTVFTDHSFVGLGPVYDHGDTLAFETKDTPTACQKIQKLLALGATVKDAQPFLNVLTAFRRTGYMPDLRAAVMFFNLMPLECIRKFHNPMAREAEISSVITETLLGAVSQTTECDESTYSYYYQVDLQANTKSTAAAGPGVLLRLYGCERFMFAVLLGDPEILARSVHSELRTSDIFYGLARQERRLTEERFAMAAATRKKELARPLKHVFMYLHDEKQRLIRFILLARLRLLSTRSLSQLPQLPYEMWDMIADFIRLS